LVIANLETLAHVLQLYSTIWRATCPAADRANAGSLAVAAWTTSPSAIDLHPTQGNTP
jgi:hypothetical protein